MNVASRLAETSRTDGPRQSAKPPFLGFGLGFRAGVELAADELDLRNFSAVAPPIADPQKPGVAARPGGKPRRDRVEQFRHDLAILHIAHDQPTGREHPAVGVGEIEVEHKR